MFVEFEQLPPEARIWVYMSDRTIAPRDAAVINRILSAFTKEWAAHGAPLKSSFNILRNRFVLLAVDDRDQGPSGCSIDASVNVMKQAGEETGINFFDRSLVPFVIDDEIVLLRLGELKEKYAASVWNAQTPTFNILAGTLGEIRDRWTVPAAQSWLRRYVEPLGQDSLAG